MSPVLWWDGIAYVDLATRESVGGFVDGVTMPYYVEAADFSGARNVGVPPAVSLEAYAGGSNNGVIQITDGAYYEGILFTGQVEVRSNATFKNCRFVLPLSFVRTDVTKAVVLILNGTGASDILFEDCEIHNRAQRPMNGIMGRNFVMRRSVVTGCVDSWSESGSGSAPNTGYGFRVYDSISPAVAWWYSPTVNSDIHGSDTGSHSDVMQKNTLLTVEFHNTVLAAYCSELIGTGTPGSGRSAGNPYVPPGYDYTASQTTMVGWKNQFAVYTTASQTMTGNVRRLASDGSMAAFMLNDGNITINNCYLGGGTVTINAVDSSVIESTVHITNNVFWNDMLNGPGSRSSDPTVKGYAVLFRLNESFGTYSNNLWAASLGGAAVPITRL